MEQSFTPYLWLEDPAPKCASDCARCELCKQSTRIIWGEGNPKANIIVILDNPGCREDKNGEEFVCGTRQTLQQAANSVGLGENDIYVTYVLKCRPVRKYDKEAARKACMVYLEQQLSANTFGIAFCLRDTAVKSFFSDPDRSVKDSREVWHDIRGLKTYVSYHPLAIRRRPNLYNIFIKDWEQVAHMSRKQLSQF